MLPIYKATSFIKILEEGGHTKPWLIEIEVEEQQNKVVVMKLYTTYQVEQKNTITSEIIGNILATEFDFSVPEIMLVDTNSSKFFNQLPKKAKEILLQSDERLKFASVYIENTSKLIPNLSIEIIENNLNLEKLYAFDNFIRNGDRGLIKTNMLLHNDTEEIYLIDHEMALDIDNKIIENIENQYWEQKFTKYHFAYNFLKEKNIQFNEFSEYIKTLHLKKLNSYFEQLENENFETQQKNIMQYFNYIKSNVIPFLNILKKSLC